MLLLILLIASISATQEIYMERLRDLLDPESEAELVIAEDYTYIYIYIYLYV